MGEDVRRVAELRMLRSVQRVTELEVRRRARGLSWARLVIELLKRCEKANGLDLGTLERWAKRAHAPTQLFWPALCEFFEVASIAQLGLGDTGEAALRWTWMDDEGRTLEVDRRRFFIATGAALGVSVLPVSKLVAGAQLLDGTGRIGAAELTFATEVATDLASRYAATPNTDVIAAAEAHAYTLAGLLKRATMTPEVRARLQSIASDAACLVGYGHMNAGRLAEADAWFKDALELARQAGDRRVEALALAASGWIPLYAPETDRGAVVAALEAAAERQRFLPPAEQAWLFAYFARERGALGDDLGSGRFLERARAAAAQIRHADPGSGWWSAHGDLAGWDGVRFEVQRGRRSLWLGRPAEAIEVFDAALDVTTEPRLRPALHEDVMGACVALGDPDRACASGMAALDEAKTHGLGLTLTEMRKVRAGFPREWRRLAPVIELDERLALTG